MQSTDRGCTIVSIVPFDIRETKPGLIPPTFEIPACPPGEVQTLVVSSATFPVYLDEARGNIKVYTTPEQVARSVVQDYINGQLARAEDAHPGIFWVQGSYTPEAAKKQFAKEIEEARIKQTNWFGSLVQLADDEWNQNHQHKTISEIQRYGAIALGLERQWLAPTPVKKVESDECPACGGSIRPGIVICPHCSAILDEERYKKMKFAKVG